MCVCVGVDNVRFKAEVNFDGREVARIHVKRLDLENMLKVGSQSSSCFLPIKSFIRQSCYYFY